MGLLSRLKKAAGLECVRDPGVQTKDSRNSSENRHPDHPDAVDTDGGRNEKKTKNFWKWPALHVPCCRAGTYDLVKTEKKCGIEAEINRRYSNAPALEVLPAVEEQQKQDVLDKGQSVHEPSVLSPIMAENRQPNPPDEAPAGAAETDGERTEKKKKSFWKWPTLHFPCCSAGTYDLVKIEKKCGIEAEKYQGHSDAPAEDLLSRSDSHHPNSPDEEPAGAAETDGERTEEVLLTAEERLVQDILDKGHFCKYTVGCKLGEGGCGSVYEGTRCKDGLQVAVKCSSKTPNMPSIKVPGHPKRLPIEIGLLLMANKGPSVPQIIQLLDWEDDADHYVMVMERPIPCVDLFSFVENHGGSLDEGTARNIMRQVTDAAKTCCKRGIFHRDFKLENLLVNEDTMEVKLIDFGCGALMKKSAFKVFHGTRVYCPPEFYMKGRYHAKPTTVWTLGFILYEMLCGEAPTSYDRSMITVKLWTRPGLSKECCQMICDCLQPKPGKRLSLDKMHLHDWFKVQSLRLAKLFLGLV
ncbi:serine/threonine-protein kinase pim-2-like [Carassius auratus]|uniref:non-specific serine/threonine protein kinase n=1 Tax=Carassius auratus TaxID=7957 RepID=A0A6P6K884_CARAU|nr:serine/threonine-protein kinase pim-2-like [Carassius auratus]